MGGGIGAGTIFRLGGAKLIGEKQLRQSNSNITLAIYVFIESE